MSYNCATYIYIQSNHTLERLNLNSTGIRTVAMTFLAIVLKDHPSIKHLHIAKPYLHSTEETCIHLSEMLKYNNRLLTLDLSSFGLRAESMKILNRGLMLNRSITNLNMCGYVSMDLLLFFLELFSGVCCLSAHTHQQSICITYE